MNEGNPVQTSSAVAAVVVVTAHAASTSGVHGITAAGTALITAATAADQRTTMGVAYGTTGTTVCVGNDSRLSDARTPVAHNQAWTTITATPTTISGYGLTDAASTGANTFTGAQLIRAAATQDAIEILGRAGGTSSYKATITPLALSASRTWSLPDRSDTFAGLKSNTFTEAKIIGTDPGGSELLRVGGGAKVGGSLTAQRLIANDGFIGSVGDISASRGDGTGCIFFSGAGTRYIYSDGNVFDFSGAPINTSSYRVSNTKVLGGQASAIADVSTADATDLTSAVALANVNKAKINTVLAMLRTHGLIAT
jgi:hypothetical protein